MVVELIGTAMRQQHLPWTPQVRFAHLYSAAPDSASNIIVLSACNIPRRASVRVLLLFAPFRDSVQNTTKPPEPWWYVRKW